MPSVWIESRKARGARVYTVRWETVSQGVRNRGSKVCGPFKIQADEFRANKLKEIYAGRLGIDAPIQATGWTAFSTAYLDHCKRHKSERTFEGFDRPAVLAFGKTIGSREVQSINHHDIAAFEASISEYLNPATVSMRLRALRAALNYAKNHGLIREVPKIHLPRVDRVGRALSDSEAQTLFDHLPSDIVPAFKFLFYTGLRHGELLALDWKAIRKRQDGRWEAEIGGLGSKETKTRKARIVPLHHFAVEAIGAGNGVTKSGPVFPHVKSSWLNHSVLFAARKAGIGRVRVHDFRHTFCTNFMRETGDLFALQDICGHRTLASMKEYQHMSRGRKDALYQVSFPTISPKKVGDEVGVIDGKQANQ